MTIPHFFILKSRLGLKYPPLGSTELNLGVEDGGVSILSADFLSSLPTHSKTTIECISPDEIKSKEYIQEVRREYLAASNQITHEMKINETQVVLGGDHSVGFPSLLSVLKREGTNHVGVLMIDSHADLHKVSTSPSGNIHGMWLRMLFEDFDVGEINQILDQPLTANQLCFVGNLQVEDEEVRFLSQHNVPVYSSAILSKSDSLQKIRKFLQSYKHIHLCFDIDVFQQSLVPATGTPNPNGLTKEEVFSVLELCKQVESLSIDLVEVNPKKAGAPRTITLAQEVLKILLK